MVLRACGDILLYKYRGNVDGQQVIHTVGRSHIFIKLFLLQITEVAAFTYTEFGIREGTMSRDLG